MRCESALVLLSTLHTPPAAIINPLIIDLIAGQMHVAFSSPVVQRFRAHGVEGAPSTPGEFHEIIRVDQQRWGKVIRKANIRVEAVP